MRLVDYIKENYDGVVLRFANDNDMKRQQVEQCIAKGYYYVLEVDGLSMLAIAKREVKEVEPPYTDPLNANSALFGGYGS